MPFTTIDLCAGIGGIRKGFELTGHFVNVSAAEIDRFACLTYQQLYGDDAHHDLTTEEYKEFLDEIHYDVLLAGFPCQTFSRAGLEEGFDNAEKGISQKASNNNSSFLPQDINSFSKANSVSLI